MPMSPTAVIAKVIAKLSIELEEIQRRAIDTAEGATHEESRPENPKDTRGLEASYLAHGLAKRASELEQSINRLRFFESEHAAESPIRTGSMVELEDEAGALHVFILLPCAGGHEVDMGDTLVRVITPQSPLGQALRDPFVGDELQIGRGSAAKEWHIVRVY